MDFLPWTTFARIVARYGRNHRVRTFPCTNLFRILAFAQLTYRESLRGIKACLTAQTAKLSHLGIHSPVKRSTQVDANERRDWRIHSDFAQRLITQARALHINEPFGVDLSDTVYALDTSTIDLCLSFFPWAHLRTTKPTIKLHTPLDLRGNIPSFIHISYGKMLVFLTNNFTLPALTVAEFYQCRWQVELFFKWTKQHLRIKKILRHFRECSKNADLDSNIRSSQLLFSIFEDQRNLNT
jgi:hypothetical protein